MAGSQPATDVPGSGFSVVEATEYISNCRMLADLTPMPTWHHLLHTALEPHSFDASYDCTGPRPVNTYISILLSMHLGAVCVSDELPTGS